MSRSKVEEWLEAMAQTSICGLGQASPIPWRNASRHWPEVFQVIAEGEVPRAVSDTSGHAQSEDDTKGAGMKISIMALAAATRLVAAATGDCGNRRADADAHDRRLADIHRPVGRRKRRADLSSITVANDDQGFVTVAIQLVNQADLKSNEGVLMIMDTDNSSTTGSSGFDYILVGIEGPLRARQVEWVGIRPRANVDAHVLGRQRSGQLPHQPRGARQPERAALLRRHHARRRESTATPPPTATRCFTYTLVIGSAPPPTTTPPPPPTPKPPAPTPRFAVGGVGVSARRQAVRRAAPASGRRRSARPRTRSAARRRSTAFLRRRPSGTGRRPTSRARSGSRRRRRGRGWWSPCSSRTGAGATRAGSRRDPVGVVGVAAFTVDGRR